MVSMDAHTSSIVKSLGETEMRCEESKQNILKSNMGNAQRIQEHIMELETDLETSRGNGKELTSELDALLEETLFISLFRPVRDALRERMVSMEAHEKGVVEKGVVDNTFSSSNPWERLRSAVKNRKKTTSKTLRLLRRMKMRSASKRSAPALLQGTLLRLCR